MASLNNTNALSLQQQLLANDWQTSNHKIYKSVICPNYTYFVIRDSNYVASLYYININYKCTDNHVHVYLYPVILLTPLLWVPHLVVNNFK